MTDTTPTDTETPDDVSFLFDDHEIDWDDGTFWFVGWSHVWNSYFADRVYDEELIDEDDHTFRSCPGPEFGMFASLDAIAAAMGEPLPPTVRHHLEGLQRPPDEEVRAAWNGALSMECHHLLPDGSIVTKYAPPWAGDWQDGPEPESLR